MYIDNRYPKNKDNKNDRKKPDIPDRTREIPFSKVPVPDVIDLDSKE